MKGGLTRTKTIIKNYEIQYDEFCLGLIRDSLVTKPLYFTHSKKNKSIGGNFVDDITSWIKIYAEPYHDFKLEHKNVATNLITHLLVRMYHDILVRTPTNFENQILLRMLKDPNTEQGISLKYCRFYKFDEDGKIEDLWNTLEQAYDELDPNVQLKLYILNATISGTGSRDFTTAYQQIVPLAAYWDPFRAPKIDFRVNDTTFYDELYSDLTRELFVATKILFKLQEHHKSSTKIILTITRESTSKDFELHRQGFSIKELKDAIENVKVKTIDKIEDEDLKNIIYFLNESGAKKNDIISFLLVCKMTGDIGTVLFIKHIDKYVGKIKYKKHEFDYNVTNKPITFLYTIDRLAASAAIANNVKCVVKCKPFKDNFICQYLGSYSAFSSSVYEPYFDILQTICEVNFRPLDDTTRDATLMQKYFEKFVATFSVQNYSVNATSNITTFSLGVLGTLTFTPEQISSPDDRIKHIIGLITLHEWKDKLTKVIKYVIKEHVKTKINVINLRTLNAYYKKEDFFDPLLQFFMDTLLLPNESIKQFVYRKLTHEIKKQIGLEFTDNYRMLQELLEEKIKDMNEMDIDETVPEDMAMLPARIFR